MNVINFCNELYIYFYYLKFGTNFLTAPIFTSYYLAISLQCFNEISFLISIFSGAN